MLEKSTQFRIVASSKESLRYVDQVRVAADSARGELGFLPAGAYEPYALKDNLLVAVLDGSVASDYAGHLLFDVTYPHAKIRQVYVKSNYRRCGVAAQLVLHLKRYLTGLQFVAIHARVGEDMLQANQFWQAQGFNACRVKPGGAARGRMIVVRTLELRTPRLFDTSLPDSANPLGLSFSAMLERPTYLLDMNVLFDIGPRRSRRRDVVNVFRAERMKICDLAISSEIIEELKRSCPPGRTDPMRDLAAIMPTYDVPKEHILGDLLADLAKIIFPHKAQSGHFLPNDVSDLRHLATVISHRLRGLITSDEAIIRAAHALQKRYSIEVLSPLQFSLDESNVADEETKLSAVASTLRLETVGARFEEQVRGLLMSLGVSPSALQRQWAVAGGVPGPCHRHAVLQGDDVVGYVIWPATRRDDNVRARMAVALNHDLANEIVSLMLIALGQYIATQTVSVVHLSYLKEQVAVRNTALSFGYVGSSDISGELQKITVNQLVCESNWSQIARDLENACGVRIGPSMPLFRGIGQHLEIKSADGNLSYLSLLEMESVLAPALLCLPGRGGVLVPIRRQYSEHLLHHLAQRSLLPRERTRLHVQRNYLSAPATRSAFSAGDLMFFYESEKGDGLGAVVAVARVVRTYLRRKDAMDASDLDASVLDQRLLDEIGKSPMKAVTVFDNLNILHRPIGRAILDKLGCGSPMQLRSSRRLTPAQVQGIVAEAV